MLKTLLILGAALFLLACGKTVLAKKGDKYIWLKAHSSYPNIQPYWKENKVDYKVYFGKYSHFNDLFNNHYGDPIGPVVAVWEVNRYLGEEPKFRDCGEKPIWNPKKFKSNTSEYKNSEKQWDTANKERRKCIENNVNLKQKAKTITYYYARSTNNQLPVLPDRIENHALYEIHLSFGSMGKILARGLSKEEHAQKDKLYSEPCYRYGIDDTCYRLSGEDSHLYYTVRSILKKGKTQKGKVSAAWEHAKNIEEEPHTWQEIKGIEITKAQYDTMKTRCEGVFSCYLDDKAPDLTAEQKAYIKATEWDIDTDESARNALIKKTEKYRHEK